MQALAERGLPSVAVDLNGHGESPLGDPADFSPRQVARDVRQALLRLGVVEDSDGGGGRAVLLGHSMGGRIAARYAADYPGDLAALVLADIDCTGLKESQVGRPGKAKRKSLFVWGDVSPDASKRFCSRFGSWEELRAELVSNGYAGHRVNFWRKEPNARLFQRPEEQGGGWWSGVNPDAQRLVRDRVINSTDAAEALRTLSEVGEAIAVRYWVAGPQWTVCDWEAPLGMRWMLSTVPNSEARVFNASHAIYKAAPEAFVDALCDLVDASRVRARAT